jgi:hypothetical protein
LFIFPVSSFEFEHPDFGEARINREAAVPSHCVRRIYFESSNLAFARQSVAKSRHQFKARRWA